MATFTNQATLTYRNNVVNSNIVVGEILETLTVTKNALLPTYEAGGNVVYVVNVTNAGNTAFNGLTFTDDLGAYTAGCMSITPLSYVEGSLNYFVNGVLAAAPTLVSADPLVANGISLPAGATGTLVYQASVNEFAPLDAGNQITNTATLSGGNLAESVSASATISVNNSPRLDITKAISPITVEPNGRITYTFTILNYGNTATVATDNVIVRDVFDPILSAISVTYNGEPWTAGESYNYNSATGEFSTVLGEITVPAASYMQDTVTGAWSIVPGQAVITVTGNISN